MSGVSALANVGISRPISTAFIWAVAVSQFLKIQSSEIRRDLAGSKKDWSPSDHHSSMMFSVVARTAFNASRNGVVRAGVVPSFGLAAVQTAEKHTLILVRHGESTWNLENKFTGWVDVPLSPKGHEEVIEAGKLMNEAGLLPEVAFTSLQKRAIRTLWHVLEGTDRMWIPTTKAWQLNERHYGALQGLDKQETVDKYGKDQVLIWRRSYDIPPPVVDRSSPHHPGNDPR